MLMAEFLLTSENNPKFLNDKNGTKVPFFFYAPK